MTAGMANRAQNIVALSWPAPEVFGCLTPPNALSPQQLPRDARAS